MPNNIELIVALLVPVVVLTVLRINAAMVFLSLCLGYVLVEFVANDSDSLINFIAPNEGSISASTLRIIFLFGPAVLTSVLTALSVKGGIRTVLNVLPAAGVAVLAFVLAVPNLTPGLHYAIESQSVWQQVNQVQAMAIGAGGFISLIFLWSQHRRGGHDKRHRF